MKYVSIELWVFLVTGILTVILSAFNIISFSHAIIATISTLIFYGIYRFAAPAQYKLTQDIPTTSTHVYRQDIDGLRALAVGAVVINHAFPEMVPGGFIGVDVFFVISGYLITRIIVEEIMMQRFSIINFYERRIRRIFPALIIVLLSTIGVGTFLLYNAEFVSLGTQILAGSGFVSNIILYQQVDYFGDLANNQPLLHLWSLGIEEQFYIFWPIIIWLAAKKRQLLIPGVIALLVISFMININTTEVDAPAAFYLLPSRFWQLGIGGLIAIHTLFNQQSTKHHYLSTFLPIIGLTLYIVGLFAINKDIVFPGWYALIPTISACLLILPHAPNWITSRFLSHQLMVWIGKISFPLYLWHWPLLVFGFMTLEHRFTPVLRIIVLACSVFLAAITYMYIEKPIRFNTKWRIPTYVFIIGIVITAGIGWSMHTKKFVSLLPNFTRSQIKNLVDEQPCDTIFAINTAQNENRLKNQNNICTFRPGAKEQSEYIIIGDSHARILAAGMIKASSNQVTLYTHNGCIPLLGIDRNVVKCRLNTLLPNVIEHLQTVPTEHAHRYIVLVGRFAIIEPNSLNSNAGANGVLLLPNVSATETKNNLQTIIDIGLRNTLTEIVDLPNTTVIFVHQVPELQFTPKNCARLVNIMQQNTSAATQAICQTSQNDVTTHFQRYRNAVDEVLGDFPSVKSFVADELFCDKTSCYPSLNGEWAYMDHHHLNLFGATKVSQSLISKYP